MHQRLDYETRFSFCNVLRIYFSAAMARLLSNMVFKGIAGSAPSFKSKVATMSAFQQRMKYSMKITGDNDTHEDFRPTNNLDSSDISVQDVVRQDVKENPVMIYMKGIPEAPQCGFSALAVKVLQQYGVPIGARNILEHAELKEGIKAFRGYTCGLNFRLIPLGTHAYRTSCIPGRLQGNQ